jgi:hypothetical protein
MGRHFLTLGYKTSGFACWGLPAFADSVCVFTHLGFTGIRFLVERVKSKDVVILNARFLVH